MRKGESQILMGIDWSVVDTNFVMEVWSGAATAQTNKADRIATMHVLSGSDGEVGQVAVAGADPVTVVDHDGTAVAAHEVSKDHHAIGGRHHALTIRGCDIYSAMKCAFTVEWIDSFSE